MFILETKGHASHPLAYISQKRDCLLKLCAQAHICILVRGAEMNVSLRHREKSAIRHVRVYPLLHHTVDILFFLNSYSEFTEPVTHSQIFFVRFAKHALSQTLVTSDSIQRYSYHFLFIPHELRKVGHLELLQVFQGIRHPFSPSAFISFHFNYIFLSCRLCLSCDLWPHFAGVGSSRIEVCLNINIIISSSCTYWYLYMVTL